MGAQNFDNNNVFMLHDRKDQGFFSSTNHNTSNLTSSHLINNEWNKSMLLHSGHRNFEYDLTHLDHCITSRT